MSLNFPPLLELDVARHLQPKFLFLTKTMNVKELHSIPPHYYGARLERILAPRHAFLVFKGLPHGAELMERRGGLSEFLVACRSPKTFCAYCNQLAGKNIQPVSPKEVEAFDALFQRGLMAAARDELTQWNNTWPLEHVNITGGQMVDLLIQHGANPLETDARGATLLHWAAGSGNLQACQVLLPFFEDGALTACERDGATPLHWAAAGADAREFGIGGHVDVCQYLIDSTPAKKELVNQPTKDGNSALMWAAWSGTLDAVKLLVRNRAYSLCSNRNGCTVAHWATSGGSLDTCRYLKDVVGIDFERPNNGGNTPLTHAVAFGRVDIVEWLRTEVITGEDDRIAAQLARDFVDWTEGDKERQQVLDLFGDWFGQC
jgi:ankyrin repeat protein